MYLPISPQERLSYIERMLTGLRDQSKEIAEIAKSSGDKGFRTRAHVVSGAILAATMAIETTMFQLSAVSEDAE